MSPGANVVKQEIKGKTSTGSPCSIWTQISDGYDGSFIIRYNIHKLCYDLHLLIKVLDTVVVNITKSGKIKIIFIFAQINLREIHLFFFFFYRTHLWRGVLLSKSQNKTVDETLQLSSKL